MEQYYENTGKKYYAGEKVTDFHPEMNYMVGTTPEGIEHARDTSELIAAQNLNFANKPQSPPHPVYDAKWRYYWKIGERPANSPDNYP